MVLRYFFFTVLFSIVLNACTNRTKSTNKNIVQQKIKNALSSYENGDIILRSGTGIISQMIRKTLNESIPFTHCGIVCNDKDSTYIIHSIAKEISGNDGVQITSVRDFLKNSSKGEVALFRLKTSYENKVKMVNQAKYYLKQKINFDYNFDLKDSNTMYCSEIIYYALSSKLRGKFFKLKTINGNRLIVFSSFLDSKNFKKIKI